MHVFLLKKMILGNQLSDQPMRSDVNFSPFISGLNIAKARPVWIYWKQNSSHLNLAYGILQNRFEKVIWPSNVIFVHYP